MGPALSVKGSGGFAEFWGAELRDLRPVLVGLRGFLRGLP